MDGLDGLYEQDVVLGQGLYRELPLVELHRFIIIIIITGAYGPRL